MDGTSDVEIVETTDVTNSTLTISKAIPTAPRAMTGDAAEVRLIILVSLSTSHYPLQLYNQSARAEVRLIPYNEVNDMDVNSSAYHKAIEIVDKVTDADSSKKPAVPNDCEYCTQDHGRAECPAVFDAGRVAGRVAQGIPNPRYLLQKREHLSSEFHRHTVEMVFHYQARENALGRLRRWNSQYRVGE
jgi:hypothetical protein